MRIPARRRGISILRFGDFPLEREVTRDFRATKGGWFSFMADAFRIERHGDVSVVVPSNEVEGLQWELIEQAADLLTVPLSDTRNPSVLFDLSEVDFFGSVFLSLLLRTWKSVTQSGGTMVLSGVSKRARELLKVTSLDTLWAIYDTREEAMAVLESD